MDALVLGSVIDSFVNKVKADVQQSGDVFSVIKQAMMECNKQVAEAVLADSRIEFGENRLDNIKEILQDARDAYTKELKDDGDYSLKVCCVQLLQETLVHACALRQEEIEAAPPYVYSTVHSATAMSVLVHASQMSKSLFVIDWKCFPRESTDEQFVSLILNAFLIQHPEMEYFLTPDIVKNEIDKLLNDNVDEQVTLQIKKFNQECSWKQRAHLLSSLYVELAVGLEEAHDFNLSVILGSRLTDLYVEQKIVEKIPLLPGEFSSLYIASSLREAQEAVPLLKKMQQEDSKYFTFKEQVHLVCADRAILYIYREYLKFNQDKLSSQGVSFSEKVLPADNQSYDQWHDVEPALKARSIDDSIALCKWFKKNRPEVESWYKDHYADYKKYWSDFYFVEVRNRCFLLGENLNVCRTKRNQLAEMFNDVTEMHYIITPYELYKILDSFEDRVKMKVDQYGREEKEQALVDVVNGINRDISKVLSQNISMSRKLLASIYEHLDKDNNRYMEFLRATLGNNCPRAINDRFQLEKYFVLQALVFNMLGYLYTYTYADKPSLYSNCAWNAVSSGGVDDDGESNIWGLVRGKLFTNSNANTDISLQEELNDSANYDIVCSDFYEKFQELIINLNIGLEEWQDLIDMICPPPEVKKHPMVDSIKSAFKMRSHPVYKKVSEAVTPTKGGSLTPSSHGSD